MPREHSYQLLVSSADVACAAREGPGNAMCKAVTALTSKIDSTSERVACPSNTHVVTAAMEPRWGSSHQQDSHEYWMWSIEQLHYAATARHVSFLNAAASESEKGWMNCRLAYQISLWPNVYDRNKTTRKRKPAYASHKISAITEETKTWPVQLYDGSCRRKCSRPRKSNTPEFRQPVHHVCI